MAKESLKEYADRLGYTVKQKTGMTFVVGGPKPSAPEEAEEEVIAAKPEPVRELTGSEIIKDGTMLDIPYESGGGDQPLQYSDEVPGEAWDESLFPEQLAWANRYNSGADPGPAPVSRKPPPVRDSGKPEQQSGASPEK
jgi:hypothetical protein